MTNQTQSEQGKKLSVFQTIFISGLVVAILDTIAASTVFYLWFGLSPVQVIQFIASSIYGPAAFDGSGGKIFAGLVIHIVTSYVIAVVYFYAYPRIRFLRVYAVAGGLLYGLIFWLVMNLFVIPNTNIQPSPFDLGLTLTSIAWHMALVGLPAALITKMYYKKG